MDALDDKLAHGCPGFRLLGCGLAVGEGGWVVKAGPVALVSVASGWGDVEGDRPDEDVKAVWCARNEQSIGGQRVVTRQWTGRTRTRFVEVTTKARTEVAA